MSKYFDLKDRIYEDTAFSSHITIGEVLSWLDEHPEQVPGRTITESELKDLAARVGHLERVGDDSRALLGLLGITVVPDPEPTNTEKLIQDLTGVMAANLSYGHKSAIASALVERGWTKAPGGENDE